MTRTDHPDPVTESAGRRWLRRLRFPVLLLAMLVVLVANSGINLLVNPVPPLHLVVGAGLAVGIAFVYRWLSRTVERRPSVPELAKTGSHHLWYGLLLGFGLFTVLMLLISVFGGGPRVSWGSVAFVGTAGLCASVAVVEETLFRGVLFRIMEERAGTVITLIVSSIVFGLTHMVNVNATLWGTLSIALTGGFLTSAAYVATRSLWLPIGIHFGWDFTHAGVFGAVLSGSATPPDSLLHITLTGPSVLTGGTFGPEASPLALLVCLVPTVFLLYRAARTGRIVAFRRTNTIAGYQR